MSSLDFELDVQMNRLELEWRQASQESIVARAQCQALAACDPDLFETSRARLDLAESKKARILAKIERLEDSILGQD